MQKSIGARRSKPGHPGTLRAMSMAMLMVSALAAAMALSILSGCAGGAGAKPDPKEKSSPSAARGEGQAAGPVMGRLQDGREGFYILESPALDDETQNEFERGVAMLEARDYEKAIAILEKVIEKSPGVTAPHIDLAIACMAADKPEPAEAHLKTALSLVPAHPVASNEYGLLLRRGGRFAEARSVYEQAAASFPEYLPVHRNLGILCDLYLNDPACALEHYEIYHAARPGDRQVKLWVADLRARLGRN